MQKTENSNIILLFSVFLVCVRFLSAEQAAIRAVMSDLLLSSYILLSYGNIASHVGVQIINLPLPPFHSVAIWFASHCLPSAAGQTVGRQKTKYFFSPKACLT